MARAVVTVFLLGLLGCAYSPPIRGLHAGMPGRLGRGQLEVGGDVGGGGLVGGTSASAPTTGGPHVAYGVSDTLVIEAGSNLNFFEGAWATAYGGVRISRAKPLREQVRLVGELELGAGVGLGGRTKEGPAWAKNPAYGLYTGVGVGLSWRWLGAYVRGRVDSSMGSLVPSTLWPTVMVGLEARAGTHLVFGVGTGLGGFLTEREPFVGLWFYQAQVALLFDLLTPRPSTP